MSEKNNSKTGEEESLTIQQRVEDFFERFYGRWGEIITVHTKKVFWFSLIFYIACATGMSQSVKFANEQEIWTPVGNPSLKNNVRAGEMFPSQSAYIGFLAEVKDESANVMDKEALKDLEAFLAKFNAFEEKVDNTTNKIVKFSDVCSK
jgi:hypothetical protein